jgi:hypothetical protein
MKRRAIYLLLAIFWIALTNPARAWAYVDPNTLGFVSQIVTPLVTLFVSCLIYFRRKFSAAITYFWRSLKRQPAASLDDGDASREPRPCS